MVALRGSEITAVPLDEAVKQLKKVDPRGEMVAAARAVGISFGV
jgi:6-phosphofructokinase 1